MTIKTKAPATKLLNGAADIVSLLRWRIESIGTEHLPAADTDIAMIAWLLESVELPQADVDALLAAAKLEWKRGVWGASTLVRK
jgi:hypothetical protein